MLHVTCCLQTGAKVQETAVKLAGAIKTGRTLQTLEGMKQEDVARNRVHQQNYEKHLKVLRCAVLCCAALRWAVLCCAVLCCAGLHYAAVYYAKQRALQKPGHDSVLCYPMLCYAASCYAFPFANLQ